MTERGLFIRVELDPGCTHGEGCQACMDVCPVDIFAPASARGPVRIQAELEDECILCHLCVQRCPPQVVRIRKLYEQGEA